VEHRPLIDATQPVPVHGLAQRVDLASERVGGKVLWANDDFFAEKENLLKAERPIWLEHEYTDRGKWMDGWETRRRRTPGHDSCIIRLGQPGVLHDVVVDTSFFRGNYPEHCSIEACAVEGSPKLEALQGSGTEWVEVLPKSALEGDAQNRFPIESRYRFTHLRFHIYPDGGVARLRVHGDVLPDWSSILARGEEIDLLAVEHGGRWIAASDMFYSAPQNLLMPGRGVRMDDGWETKRRRGPGFDWVVLQLGIAGTVDRVEVDTAHFKGNYPDACSLEGAAVEGGSESKGPRVASPEWIGFPWREIVPRTKLEPDTRHELPVADRDPITHARINIYPDGGVSRLRLWGHPTEAGRVAEGLRRLNALLPRQAKAAFLDCCGAPGWARAMNERRPFAGAVELFTIADGLWRAAGGDDWLAAIKSHPEIGGTKAETPQSGAAAAWSASEQAGATGADAATREALAAANKAYRERFGHTFIVCATGKSAAEMLSLCKARMGNKPAVELEVAAEEQRKITRLRLDKLLRMET
jgi:allantoicase